MSKLALSFVLVFFVVVGSLAAIGFNKPIVATGDQRHHMRLSELPFELTEIIPHNEEGLLEDIGEYMAWLGYVIDLRDGTYYNWFLYSKGCAVHVLPLENEDYYSWTTCPEEQRDENSG